MKFILAAVVNSLPPCTGYIHVYINQPANPPAREQSVLSRKRLTTLLLRYQPGRTVCCSPRYHSPTFIVIIFLQCTFYTSRRNIMRKLHLFFSVGFLASFYLSKRLIFEASKILQWLETYNTVNNTSTLPEIWLWQYTDTLTIYTQRLQVCNCF